jgi:hypothetical protein
MVIVEAPKGKWCNALLANLAQHRLLAPNDADELGRCTLHYGGAAKERYTPEMIESEELIASWETPMFEMNGTVVIMIQTYPLEWMHWQQP